VKAEAQARMALPPGLVVPETQVELERLKRQCFVALARVQQFHTWLDDKRQCRQACRISCGQRDDF